MSVKSAGWDAICDGCGRPYGPTLETRAEAILFDRESGMECADCAAGRHHAESAQRSAEGAHINEGDQR